jgi:hypothetical protein
MDSSPGLSERDESGASNLVTTEKSTSMTVAPRVSRTLRALCQRSMTDWRV